LYYQVFGFWIVCLWNIIYMKLWMISIISVQWHLSSLDIDAIVMQIQPMINTRSNCLVWYLMVQYKDCFNTWLTYSVWLWILLFQLSFSFMLYILAFIYIYFLLFLLFLVFIKINYESKVSFISTQIVQ